MDNKWHLPALILIYSAIDAVSSLGADEAAKDAGKRYIAWVDRYMLRAKPLPCTAEEIYGARCGLVHTLTAESTRSLRGKARRVYYAWGTATAADLQRTIDATGREDLVAVHIEDLFEALVIGIKGFLANMDRDVQLASRMRCASGHLFTDLGKGAIQEYLDMLDSDAAGVSPGRSEKESDFAGGTTEEG